MPTVTDPLILPSDVSFSPVSALSKEVRERLDYEQGDVAITRIRSRTPSKVVNVAAAALLQEFRSPKTISEAVVRYSASHKSDPHETLERAFPLIQELVNSQLLVPNDTPQAAEIAASLDVDQQVDGLTIVRCVQTLEDTELYQVRDASGTMFALKLARGKGQVTAALMLEHEARILRHLGDHARTAMSSEWDGRAYLALHWFAGVSADIVAEEYRQQGGEAARANLLALCLSILDAYRQLHDQGVIHGDVHPRNLLVNGDRQVRIIDFGLARIASDADREPPPPRGGVAFFFEPEYALARLEQRRLPLTSMRGEQYSLAALVYFLLTGDHYLNFSLGQDEMLQEIAAEPPQPFSDRGVEPWPGVEQVLGRALSKDPQQRFPGVEELVRVLGAAGKKVVHVSGVPAVSGSTARAEQRASRVLQRLGWNGDLLGAAWPGSPSASINYGAAGAAFFLYRAACLRGDPSLLALADVWAGQAAERISDENGFYNGAIEISPETVGRVSPYHTPSGVHVVQALIARARGDDDALGKALAEFVAAVDLPCENLDLTLGQAGVLLASTLLVESLPDQKLAQQIGLLSAARSRAERISAKICARASILDTEKTPSLGIAHGWAGLIYATMRWSDATKQALPVRLEGRLDELADYAEYIGRGARWPWQLGVPDPNYMPGWCNGSAGHVFLWTLAHRLIGTDRYATLAEKAAWNAWEEPGRASNLCCGWAGRGYALLHWYKYTGERTWLRRAQVAAERATEFIDASMTETTDGFENSLYKGEVGVAALVSDLSFPEMAAMPLFESELAPGPA